MKIVLIVVGAVAGALAVMFLLASVAIMRVGEDMQLLEERGNGNW